MIRFKSDDGSDFVLTNEPSNPVRCFGCCTASQKHRANRSEVVFSVESPLVKRLGKVSCRVCQRSHRQKEGVE
jgi:hypothetical protein